jgi:ubiquinone/menaquinone biosynthesis C-methylase UbiE
MGLKLESIVPWGRNAAEYQRMFALSPADLSGTILDCGGGPASFNAEMTQQGQRVTACDPLYQFTAAEIEQQVEATWQTLLAKVQANQADYVWDQAIASPEQLGQVRLAAMREFIQDLPIGLKQHRYVVAALPQLPFADRHFDLALCSHLLFTYSDLLSLDFHLDAIAELNRVAAEVRIFPVVNLSGEPSPHLNAVLDRLRAEGWRAELQTVPYEFQKGANRMLVVNR